MPYATQLGGLQINSIEMFIKVAFVILLSVEIEACKENRHIPKNPNNQNVIERSIHQEIVFEMSYLSQFHSYQESQNFEFKSC